MTAWPARAGAGPAAARGAAVRELRRVWRQALLARRRLVVAGLVAAAVAAGLRVLAPAPPASVPVLVAAADLPAGHPVAAADLRSVAWPRDLRPPGAMAADAVTGRVLAGPVRAGEPLTDTRVRGSGLLTGLPVGLGTLAVRLDEPVAGLVRPGERVDLVLGPGAGGGDVTLGTSARTASVVAHGLLVLSAGTRRAEASSLPFADGARSPGTVDDDSLLVVAVSTATALRIRAATGAGALSVIGRG